jgi:hypothetical protein
VGSTGTPFGQGGSTPLAFFDGMATNSFPGSGRGGDPRRSRVPSADHIPQPTSLPAPRPIGSPAPAAQPAAPSPAQDAGTAAGAASAESAGPEKNSRKRVIVDGSNVAHAGEHGARLSTLLAVRDELIDEGFDPIIVADAALRHQIDDGPGYEQLIEEGTVQQAPAGTDADYFILSFAKELGASIVSNDQFRDGGKLAAEARERRIRFMVVAGEVVLEKRGKRR